MNETGWRLPCHASGASAVGYRMDTAEQFVVFECDTCLAKATSDIPRQEWLNDDLDTVEVL